MSQGIKKTVQKALLLPRKNKYEKDRLRLIREHEKMCALVDEYVTSDIVLEETGKVIERIEIGELVTQIKDGVNFASERFYLIYNNELGELRNESERLVFEFVRDNPYAVFIYGDEDYFAVSGDSKEADGNNAKHAFRFFKPCFSPETLASFDYINAFAIRGDLLNKISKKIENSEDNSATLYELTVEVVATLMNEDRVKEICHIPAVLTSKAIEVCDKDLTQINQTYKAAEILYSYFVKKELSLEGKEYESIRKKAAEKMGLIPSNNNPSVSVIIPSKDNPDMLISCIGKLGLETIEKAELIVVDNGSSKDNKERIEKYLSECKFKTKYIYEESEFNYSRMNNAGAKEAEGEVLILLNDDIEANDNGFVLKMASKATAKGVGCVGCKLLYPDGNIQHVGIAGGVDGPAHKHMGESDTVRQGHGDNTVNRNVLAVTGACLSIRRDLYEEVGGLNEELKVGYNDVDLCMTLYEKGMRNVLLNEISLIHHESVSRGKDAKNKQKTERLRAEKEILKKRHPKLMTTDPYEGGSEDFRLDFIKNEEKEETSSAGSFTTRNANDDEGWIYSSFEKLEVYNKTDTSKTLRVKGFALVPGIDNMRFDFEMILEKDAKQFVIPIERKLRTDLAGRFNGSENTELCGIDFNEDISMLDAGEYEIKMYAKDHGNVRELITDTEQIIRI